MKRNNSRHTMADMLNAPPDPKPAFEFQCKVCQKAVYEGTPTELGLEIESCPDCEAKRIQHLLTLETKLEKVAPTITQNLCNLDLWLQNMRHLTSEVVSHG